jgi:O-acetylserine/cysteine efflux transporter
MVTAGRRTRYNGRGEAFVAAESDCRSVLKRLLKDHRADLLMSGMVFVWGFNFIVLKNGVENIPPLTFNALRFLIGLPLILLLAWCERHLIGMVRRDIVLVGLLALTGPVLYQIGFALGIKRTTSTNAALLVATMPTWTALVSIMIGMVQIRRRLLIGMGVTLVGVLLVVYSRSSGDFALSHDDLIGSALLLAAAIANGIANVVNKPVVDRLGGMRLAIWKYVFTTIGLSLIAAPGLLSLSGHDLPLRVVPNILYSGILSGVGGFVIVHYALHEMDPTRSASYYNFNPIVAAFAGILILGEPFSLLLLAGGVLTVGGVVVVRNNIYARRKPAVREARVSTSSAD